MRTISYICFDYKIIREKLKTKYSSVFAGNSLKTLSFESPSNIGKIPQWSFAGCKGLKTIKFAAGINSIGVSSFEGCASLTNLELGEDIVNISMNAFKGCLELQTVKIPDGSKLQPIETLAFYNCPKLLSFNVSNTNKEFSTEDGVLYNYNRTQIVLYLSAHPRKEFTVSESVKELLIYSFQNAENLISIILPEGLTKIGFGAFSGCKMLQHVNIPSKLASIGNSAFTGCASLGCGSIAHDPSQKAMLIKADAPINALTPCPTGSFTVVQSTSRIMDIILPVFLYSKGERNTEVE